MLHLGTVKYVPMCCNAWQSTVTNKNNITSCEERVNKSNTHWCAMNLTSNRPVMWRNEACARKVDNTIYILYGIVNLLFLLSNPLVSHCIYQSSCFNFCISIVQLSFDNKIIIQFFTKPLWLIFAAKKNHGESSFFTNILFYKIQKVSLQIGSEKDPKKYKDSAGVWVHVQSLQIFFQVFGESPVNQTLFNSLIIIVILLCVFYRNISTKVSCNWLLLTFM